MEQVTFNEMLALTATEWLHWVASGHIRYILYSGRINHILNLDDFSEFASLMNSAPNINYMDDGGFVIAKLKSNWKEFLYLPSNDQFMSNDQFIWLLIQGVETFFPVSERGARLLNGDARRAKVALGAPLFQDLWDKWVSNQTLLRAHWRGKTFAKTLGFKNPDIDLLPDKIKPFLLGDSAVPFAQNIQQLSATPAFGWANAFSLFGHLVGEQEKNAQIHRLRLTDIIFNLRHDNSIRSPILYESAHLNVAAQLSDAISKINNSLKVSVKFLVVVFHYLGLLGADKDIELESLVKDLAALIETDDTFLASNAAYLIGRKMEDIQVTSLYYSQFSNDFPALSITENVIIPDWRSFTMVTLNPTVIPQNNPEPKAVCSRVDRQSRGESTKNHEPAPEGLDPNKSDKHHKSGKGEPKLSSRKTRTMAGTSGNTRQKPLAAEQNDSNRLIPAEPIPTEETTAKANGTRKCPKTPPNNKTNRK
ncbi:MAG: hypothetical protein LBT40_13515 [Deltaproteobacteria bacterium]|jgi:hypothetical protein|nr:hypothetical protein [Deltaproteobacteria bacterium]